MLGMSQSAASAAIKALEHGSGVQLFNRVGRAIELSPAGRRFLPEAKAVLERIAEARHVLENASQTIAGSDRDCGQPDHRQLLAAAPARRLPGGASGRQAWTSASAIRARSRTRCSTARRIWGWSRAARNRIILRRTRVDVDRLMLVVARTHPEVAELSPGQPDIASLRWIVRESGSGTREVLQDLARRMGIRIRFAQHISGAAEQRGHRSGGRGRRRRHHHLRACGRQGGGGRIAAACAAYAAGARLRRHLASRPPADAVPDRSEVVSARRQRFRAADRLKQIARRYLFDCRHISPTARSLCRTGFFSTARGFLLM